MTEIALGFAVNSQPFVRAVADMNQLVPAAKKVGDAADQMSAKTTAAFQSARTSVRQAANDMVQDANQMASRINTALNIRPTVSFEGNARSSFEAFGTEIDRLRTKFNPLYAEINRYKTIQSEIRQANALGALSHRETAAALDRERKATLDSISAIKQRKQALSASQSGGMTGGQRFGTAMLGQQFFDVGVVAQMGQNPFVSGIQQGPQIGLALEQALGNRGGKGALGAVKALGTGLLSLASPLNLIGIGAAVAGGALVQWFTSGKESAKSFDDILKEHRANVDDVAKSYGLASVNLDKYLTRSSASAQAMARLTRRELGSKAYEEQQSLTSKFGAFRDADNSRYDIMGNVTGFEPAQEFAVKDKFKPFETAISRLVGQIQEGRANFDEFDRSVERTVQRSPHLRGLSNEVYKFALEAEKAAEQIKALDAALADMARKNDSRRESVNGQNEARRYVALRGAQLEQFNNQFAADQQMARARTNAEKIAAIEAQVRARARQDGDKEGGLEARVARAREAEINRQAIAARDAAEQRSVAMTQAIAQQQNELNLIGRTTGEAAGLRYEFERMQELREEARRTGGIVSDAEVERVKAAAAQIKAYADEAARLKLVNDLAFERSQLGRTSDEQAIASRLRGTGLSSEGPEAAIMRQNQALERQVKLWEDIRKQGMDAYNDIFDLALDGFDDWEDTLGEMAKNWAKQIGQMGWLNPYLNEQYGQNLPTLDNIGGIGGFFKTMLGQTANPAAGLGQLGTMANPMYVTFAGGIGLGGFGNGSDTSFLGPWGKAIGGANDNSSPASKAITSAFGPGGGGSYSVDKATDFIRQYSQAIGIDPETALKVARSEGLQRGTWQSNFTRNGIREPSFGPLQLLKGGKGTGFTTGMGNDFMRATGLDPADPNNWQQATAYGLQQAKQNGWGAWYGAKAQGITGFQGINRNAPTPSIDILTKQADTAAKSLSLVSQQSMTAQNGLGQFGTGLDKFGSSLASALSSSGGAGGGGGSGLFGSLLSGIGGLFGFANGTENAPQGWAWVGERGPELRKLRSGDVIRSNPKSMQMVANSNGGGVRVENHVHNNAGVDVRTETSDDGQGGIRQDVYIDRVVSKAVASGSSTRKSLGGLGARPMTKVR